MRNQKTAENKNKKTSKAVEACAQTKTVTYDATEDNY